MVVHVVDHARIDVPVAVVAVAEVLGGNAPIIDARRGVGDAHVAHPVAESKREPARGERFGLSALTSGIGVEDDEVIGCKVVRVVHVLVADDGDPMLRVAFRGHVEHDRVTLVDGVVERAQDLGLAVDDAAVELVGHVLAKEAALAFVVVVVNPAAHLARRDGRGIGGGVAQARAACVLEAHLVDERLVELEHAALRLQFDAGCTRIRRRAGSHCKSRSGQGKRRNQGDRARRRGDALRIARERRNHVRNLYFLAPGESGAP